MGYTHYWKVKKAPIIVSENQHKLIDEVLRDHADVIDVVQNDDKGIMFNGIDSNSHEDFYVNYKEVEDFNFCKTARKPYDVAVCKVLLILSKSKGFTFSSDGDTESEEGWGPANDWIRSKPMDVFV